MAACISELATSLEIDRPKQEEEATFTPRCMILIASLRRRINHDDWAVLTR